MQNDDMKVKGIRRPEDLPATTEGKSLKRQWQTPEIIEEDFPETGAGVSPPGPPFDGVGYS
jgi:hypothetical protein